MALKSGMGCGLGYSGNPSSVHLIIMRDEMTTRRVCVRVFGR